MFRDLQDWFDNLQDSRNIGEHPRLHFYFYKKSQLAEKPKKKRAGDASNTWFKFDARK